jgi:endonuclease III
MPMDERTKATVRALLDRHPRGYVAEETGFTVTNTAAGLFRLLCLSILADDATPSRAAVDATRALLSRRWDSAPEMSKTNERERAEVIAQAGYDRAEEASRRLGEATRLVMDRYDGDLQNLRKAAGGDHDRLVRLLREIPGMDDAGLAVFLRDAQMFWPEAGPFVDEHAARAAERLDLPSDGDTLLRDVARGGGHEQLSWLVGALAIVDAHDEYDRIRKAAHV